MAAAPQCVQLGPRLVNVWVKEEAYTCLCEQHDTVKDLLFAVRNCVAELEELRDDKILVDGETISNLAQATPDCLSNLPPNASLTSILNLVGKNRIHGVVRRPPQQYIIGLDSTSPASPARTLPPRSVEKRPSYKAAEALETLPRGSPGRTSPRAQMPVDSGSFLALAVRDSAVSPNTASSGVRGDGAVALRTAGSDIATQAAQQPPRAPSPAEVANAPEEVRYNAVPGSPGLSKSESGGRRRHEGTAAALAKSFDNINLNPKVSGGSWQGNGPL